MSRSSVRGLAAAVALATTASLGCWEQVSYDWFPQMKEQLPVQAFEATSHEGHPEGFLPPEGAVPHAVSSNGSVHADALAAMGIAEQDAVPNPQPVTFASLKRGETFYLRYCSTCHGPEGAGNGPVAGLPFGTGPFGLVLPIGGPTSVAKGLSDGHIYTTITLGRGRMPSYSRIPAEVRWDIVNYVRALNDQAITAAKGGSQ